MALVVPCRISDPFAFVQFSLHHLVLALLNWTIELIHIMEWKHGISIQDNRMWRNIIRSKNPQLIGVDGRGNGMQAREMDDKAIVPETSPIKME